MNTYPMRSFLSQENIKLHTDYLKTLRDKHSINEKSIPDIKGKTPAEISGLDIKKNIKSEILLNIITIKSHETYFSSFACAPSICPELKKHYSSEAAFLFELFCAAKGTDSDFLYVFVERNRPVIRPSREAHGVYISTCPVLALDLCEHAYFLDYRFRRDEYIHQAIEHLDLSLLDAYVK